MGPQPQWQRLHRKNMTRTWTDEQKQIIRDMYENHPTQEIADLLGRTISQVYGMATRLGLHKSEEFQNSPLSGRLSKGHHDGRGNEARFRKGHVPFNKGTKGVTGMHPNSRRTQFKKGERRGVAAEVYQPIGAEVVRDGYLVRKVNDDLPLQARWKPVHRILWEEHHGPIPSAHIVHFIDGDKSNISIENLELVSRQEWMARNRIENLYPEPVREQIHALRGFKRKLNNYAKKQDRRSA